MTSADPAPQTGPGDIPKPADGTAPPDAIVATREPEPAPAGQETPAARAQPPASSSKLVLVCAGFGVAALTVIAGYSWQREQATEETQTGLKNDIGAVLARLENNEKAAANLTKAQEQSAALEKRLTALEQRPAPRDTAGDAIAGVDKRLAVLEAASRTAAAPLASLDTLMARVAALESAARPAEPPEGSAATPREPADPGIIASLERRLAALETAPRAAPAGGTPVDLTPLETSIETVAARVGALEKSLGAPKTEIRATEPPAARAQREPDVASLAVVAQAILTALQRGDGFAAELSAAENLGAAPAALAALKPLASGSAPPSGKLAQSFRQVSRAVLDSVAPEQPAGSILDRLTGMASRLVRVRPAGEAPGEDPAALVSQIEAALDRGAVRQAVAAWDRLPAPARKASEIWAAGAKARAGAETAAQSIFTAAIAELARKRSAP